MEYRTQALDSFNSARVCVSEILAENGFNTNKIYTSLKKGSHTYDRFEQLLNDSSISHEQGDFFVGDSDIITLPSKKHPNVTLKFEKVKDSRGFAYYDGSLYVPARIIYDDKNLKFYDRYAQLTLNDGTNIHFNNPIYQIKLEKSARLDFDRKIDTIGGQCGYRVGCDYYLYDILDSTNDVFYMFKANRKGMNNLIGIRDYKNPEAVFLNETSLTPQSARQISPNSKVAQYYLLDTHWTYKPDELVIMPKSCMGSESK